MLLTIVGLVLFASLPLGIAGFYVAGMTVGFGLASLLGAPLRFVALEAGGTHSRGASQGLLTVFLSSGRLIGASVIGGVAAAADAGPVGYRRAMLLIAVACAGALTLSFWLRRGPIEIGSESR